MNREKKFRVWDNIRKVMHEFDLGDIYKGSVGVYEFDAINFDNDKVMQYTGHKDKNGKKIFEEDIIKRQDNGSLESKRLEVVEYKINDVLDVYHFTGYVTGWWEKGEVIGNNIENPELIKKP